MDSNYHFSEQCLILFEVSRRSFINVVEMSYFQSNESYFERDSSLLSLVEDLNCKYLLSIFTAYVFVIFYIIRDLYNLNFSTGIQ